MAGKVDSLKLLCYVDIYLYQIETKLKSAERQREMQQQQKFERQKLQEERIKKARLKKEKLLLDDDIISDVERDDNFNNDDGKRMKSKMREEISVRE